MLEIKFDDTKSGSKCHIRVKYTLGKPLCRLNSNCHGKSYGDLKKITDFQLFFSKESTSVSEEDFIKWLKFCQKCGFYNKYLGFEQVNIIDHYSKLDKECYCVKLPVEKYSSTLHLFAAVTLIRMISYSYSSINSREIVSTICELRNNLSKKVSDLNCAIMGHIVATEFHHCFLNSGYSKLFSFYSNDSIIKEYIEADTLNSVFSNGVYRINCLDILKHFKEKKYGEIEKMLKDKIN